MLSMESISWSRVRKPDRTAACCGEGGDMGECEWDKEIEEKKK